MTAGEGEGKRTQPVVYGVLTGENGRRLAKREGSIKLARRELLHRAVVAHPAFREAGVTTRWLENTFLPAWNPAPEPAPLA